MAKQTLTPKTIESYLQKISLKADGTVKNVKAALSQLDRSIQEKEGATLAHLQII